MIWSQGSSIHVGAKTVNLAPLGVESFVATTGGVYFLHRTELWFSDLGKAKPTGIAKVDELAASSDGRYVGFIDYERGEHDRYETPLAATVVYDTTTGKRILKSSVGMGSTNDDDLADLYEDASPSVIGFDDDTFYAQTTSDVYAFPLNGDKPSTVASAPIDAPAGVEVGIDRAKDGTVKIEREIGVSPYPGTLGPGERFGVASEANYEFIPFDVATGKPVKVMIKAKRFRFGAWTGPSTFYGAAMADVPTDEGGYIQRGIWSCDLAKAACQQVVGPDAVDPVLDIGFGGAAGGEF